MVVVLDLDWLGILIFLWFIFNGFKNSQKAKQKYAERQKRTSTQAPVSSSQKSKAKSKSAPNVSGNIPRPVPLNMAEKSKETQKGHEKAQTKQPKSKATKGEQRPRRDVIKKQERSWVEQDYGLEVNEKAIVNGMIWSEILAQPRAKRKHR